MRLVGRITNVIDLGADVIRAVAATDDGRTFTFGVLDSQIPPEDWTIDLRVSFEEGPLPGEAKHVKFYSVDPASGKTVVSVAVDGVRYVPFDYGGDTYAHGVEVSYTYWVENGWRNYSMEIVPVGFSGDLFAATQRESGHADFGRSPNVSVFHLKSGAANQVHDTPVIICDGVRHSATAIVRFGPEENVGLGAEVSVRVALRVTTGQSGNGIVQEAIAEQNLTITEKSENPRQSHAISGGPYGNDTATGDWASTRHAW